MRPPKVRRLPSRPALEALFEGAVLALWLVEHDTLQIAQALGASEAQVYNVIAKRPAWARRRRRPEAGGFPLDLAARAEGWRL
jgi:hypothetical protein